MSNCIANFALLVEQQAQSIKEKWDLTRGKRLVEANKIEEEISRCYQQIKSLFRQIQNDITLSVWNAIDEQVVNVRLERLAPAKMAKYNSSLSIEISRRTCTEGTRTSIPTGLDDWTNDSNMPPIYWMDGMAGTGKTTIACTFSKRLEERNQLGASFFCSRTSPDCRDASRIVPTIAYQLARYSIPFQFALCEVLSDDPDIGSLEIPMQFQRLLKEPLMRVKDAIPGHVVVVIDALDECTNRNAVGLILNALLEFATDLPLLFFVASRPEPDVFNRLLPQGPNIRAVLHLHEIEKSLVQADVELYLKEELQKEDLRKQFARKRWNSVFSMTQTTKQYAEIDLLYATVLKSVLEEEGLEKEEVESLQLILWTIVCAQEPINVDTLSALIGQDEPEGVEDALRSLLSVLHFSQTTRLVSTLHASFPDFIFSKERSGSYFCNVAHHSQLLAHRCFEVMKGQLRFNICKLESSFLLDRDVKDLGERVSNAISPSLSYCSRYWSDHLRLAATSEDLCQAVSDFLSERLLFWMEVMNLNREAGAGAEALLKAKLWLRGGVASSDLVRLAQDSENFITSFVVNPMSQSTPYIYISLLPFCSKSSLIYKHYWKYTRGLIEVSGSVMEHREFAALARWHVGSPVWSAVYSSDGTRLAYGCEDGTIGILNAYDSTHMIAPSEFGLLVGTSPSSTLLRTTTIDAVSLMAFLPDGIHLATTSDRASARIWNTRDGSCVAGPFGSPSSGTMRIGLSSDSKRFATRAWDGIITVRNFDDGSQVTNPFQGRSGRIQSFALSPNGVHVALFSKNRVLQIWKIDDGTSINRLVREDTILLAFSPDDKRILTCSASKKIRVRCADDGVLVAGPFQGHSSMIHSVAFSPDGTRVVSGSGDCTIQVWNAYAGTLHSADVEGHGAPVLSVVFSPGGQCIVSGSADRTIRVWNTRNGTPILRPFEGHSGKVTSVAISADGGLVVSGSADSTVRVWSTQNGATVAGSSNDHVGGVSSVALSPNGTLIAFVSGDCRIRVWNLQNSEIVKGPFSDHSHDASSVAFSPDGAFIASGSSDRTVRVWGLSDAMFSTRSFTGHTRQVTSIVFSPDSKRIASSSSDNTIRIWSILESRLVAGPFRGHTKSVNSVAFSPDGTRIVSGSSDHTTRLWNAHDGTPIGDPLRGHAAPIMSVAFSPDGTLLASGSDDNTIRVWDLQHIPHPRLITRCFPTATSVIANLASSLRGSKVRDDGWVVDNQARLLFWLPPDIAYSLPTIQNPMRISPPGSLCVNFNGDVLLGDRWSQCYITEK
ncbi:hypothetical protein CTheo_6370 [Ceratobasidium theobromae]|uniref:Nephrocystin 3-like N-terminal domain-containing protein n=1 Tax=Ceratobasidium theobromae TaxID=1582974 RepID=A0A5N5QFU8_9AGAM|nr:hypothetical protein CTheo_6370 [Ceratobasidium theobromae]